MDKAAKQALCVINPASGRGVSPQKLIEAIQEQLSVEYALCFQVTENRGDAERIVAHTQADLVICCGGDGTLNEVAAGLCAACVDVPVLYIPCGTTNDIARTLKIPARVKKSIGMLSAGRAVPLDIGRTEDGGYFTYIAAFGAFTQVSYATPHSLKKRLGYLAYLIQSIKEVRDLRPYHAAVKIDGQPLEGEFIFCSLTNSYSIGGAIRLREKDVQLNDGVLEVLLVHKPANPIDFLRVLGCLLLRKFDARGIILKNFHHLEIDLDEAVDWTMDGEYGGKRKHLAAHVEEGALHVFAKQP